MLNSWEYQDTLIPLSKEKFDMNMLKHQKQTEKFICLLFCGSLRNKNK